MITKYNLTHEQQLQLLLPIGLMNSSEIYVNILTIWLKNGLPNENLAKQFFQTTEILYNHLEDVEYPRIPPLKERVHWNEFVTKKNFDILQSEIKSAQLKTTTQKIIDQMSKITFLTTERSNQILQVSILAGMVTNTYHNIANQNTKLAGVKHYFGSLKIYSNQKITVLLKNLPNVLNMPGQRIESILDNWGNGGGDYRDIIYKNMDIYDVTEAGTLIIISKHS